MSCDGDDPGHCPRCERMWRYCVVVTACVTLKLLLDVLRVVVQVVREVGPPPL
jgi:hypothetical protein